MDSFRNGPNTFFDTEPTRRADDDDRDPARRKVLLISQALVGRNENLEPGGLSLLEQFAVRQRAPSKLGSRADLMIRKVSAQVRGSALIEKDAHSRRFQRSGSVLKYKPGLLARDTGKPREKVRELSSILQILEQCSNWNARIAEYPGAADALRIPFDGGARGPVNHVEMLGPKVPKINAGRYVHLGTSTFASFTA